MSIVLNYLSVYNLTRRNNYLYKTVITRQNEVIYLLKNLNYYITKLKVNIMNTKFTKVTILVTLLATALFNTSAQANISSSRINQDKLSIADLNIENEINISLQQMLSTFDTDILQHQINKQLSDQVLELKTKLMVKEADEQFPAFKFKVIIAD